MYGVCLPDMVGLKGVARRAVSVVDTRGIIRYSQVLESPGNEPDCARLNEAIAKLA